jgi:hypothetical protein
VTNFALFVHILGAMTLFGAVLAALVLARAGRERGTFTSLAVAVPAWAAALVGAYWTESREHLEHSNATWLTLGHNVLEPGLVVLLLALGTAYWWRQSGSPRAGRIVAALSGIYLVLLALAWLAMSGKWK